jgi:serine/threonine-protein kinase
MQADRVGKYHIIAKLGEGGMATVFLSCVPGPAGFNKLLVVKLLKADLEHDEDFLAMFLNEARIAARLNHPNVVQTYEVGVEGSRHFLAMDYLDGQPLHAIIRKVTRSNMPLDLHVRILADVLAGLQYAHTLRDFDGTPLGVVHRDVSPQNVFVTYDGMVKLVDFGIAKATGAASTTQSGMFKGKLAYMAPEQAGGDLVDARTDVFSVGVMLWEAIAGQRFAHGEGQTAILGRRLAGTEPRIREVRADADPELAAICDRAMAHRREDRFASAAEFRDALEGFLDHSSRRVGSREIAALVGALFADERDQIRRVIDEQMRRLARETSTALPVPMLTLGAGPLDRTPITSVDRRGLPSLRAAPALESGPGSLSDPHSTLVAADLGQRPPSPAGRGILAGLAVMTLASVVGIVVLVSLKTQPPTKVEAASPAAADAAAESDRIKLSITFGPAGAIARLDGVPLADSPFVAQVPRDGSMHRIDVEGPGLKSETKMVSYEKNIVVAVSLVAAETQEPEAGASGSASAPPAQANAPGEGWRRSGADGPARGKPGKAAAIDEKDPYKP